MLGYKKTSDNGKCENCGKEISGLHHLYRCQGCGYALCSGCVKKTPPCRCVNGVPPLKPEQQEKMNTLTEMGFPDYISIFALKKFNWDINECIPWIIENLATFPRPELPKEVKEEKDEKEDTEIQSELDGIEDQMKWKETKDTDLPMVKGKKRKRSSKVDDEDDDEWHEDVFDDDLYDNGRAAILGDPSTEKCYEVIESHDIVKMITNLCVREADNLCIDEGNASVLLKNSDWSGDKLESKYFDNIEKVCKDSGVVIETPPPPKDESCSICYEEGKMLSLGCGHYFCSNCWNERISTLLKTSGSNVIDSLCMQHGCTCRINYVLVKKACNEETYKRFMYFICKDFISHRKSYVFCPVDTCGRAIHYFDTSRHEVQIVCKCGQRFCFQCGREMHKPVSCEQFMQWNDLVSNDSESMKFVNTISKPCFHCGLYTERVDGCNHMTCSRCKGEWCWMCRGDWKTHGTQTGGFYKCNLYDKSEAKKLDMKADELKNENKRFLEYFDSYIKYNNLERGVNKAEEKMKLIESNKEKTTGKPCKELSVAAEVLKEAFSVVKYSFVFSYFVRDYEQISKLFLFRQKKDIESVETLWNMLEKETDFNFEKLQKVRQMTKIVKKVAVSLADVSTENLMKGRLEEVKKKKSKK
ncbi:protein ariadne-1, putative [Entamoeba invadens IP1]|uniref:RBR-type E3 ubiquitin transferase n=1 Tax=Entamoeba invadens IP1 TaxID=370355 RepID=A0A0A1UCL6_ENTIV|nr:protein ariadne-1, putative [Entamoeba invadens IP1]ELP90034.1 protein ariadne-1, putative [Entamoeba invadens IP1]|eukprot:XP_004256805.1 protein ariadne-1, putative [Entamoeba invadens IP1]